MEEHNVPFRHLKTIIITHQDIDHIGSLPDFISKSPHKLDILASEIEKPYIQGEKMLIKITPESIEQAVASLPADISPEWRKAFRSALENPPKGPVNGILEDGLELANCGGIIVIHTPGHTPGHVSLYHKQSKTLIAADALVVSDGQLLGPIPEYSVNYELAMQSIKKFIKYDIEAVICYHGGLYHRQRKSTYCRIGSFFYKLNHHRISSKIEKAGCHNWQPASHMYVLYFNNCVTSDKRKWFYLALRRGNNT